jgi:predicted nuclease of predicted toxin-antitoxin system
MKFLADENFPYPSIKILREAGYTVESIFDSSRGIADIEIIHKAQSTGAIILTFDKDYGEIIFRHSIVQPPPVIFFRFKGKDPGFVGTTLLKLIESQIYQLDNCFTVIESDNIRQRKY